MNYVASSFGAAWTNFVSSQAVSVNCGSSAGRFIVGISMATNGGTAAARNLSSANYGGVGLTLSAVESNNFGSYFQAAHGATTLTGANDFQAVCANNNGGIFVAAAAFDGCAASPLSGLVKSGADNSAPTATVSSATGRTVYAIVAEIGTQSTLTPGAGVTVLATADASTSRFHLLSIAGGSSVTVGGTFPGARSWSMWAWSLQAAAAAPVLSSPSGTVTSNTAATITHTTDTPGTGNTHYLRRTGGSAALAAAIIASGESQATGGAGSQSRSVTLLGGTASQFIDIAQAGPSNVITVGPLSTATTLSSPTGAATGTTTATAGFTTDRAVSAGFPAYFLTLPSATAAPADAAELIANGATVSQTTGGTTPTRAIAGLTAATAYRTHMAQPGSNVVSSAPYTTDAGGSPPPPPPPAAGFDFHTLAGCIFGAISGSLVGLAREVGVSITTRVYSATTGALVATLPATSTDSNGRLPRLTDAALVSGTSYRLVFVWPDGACYAINLAATA